MYLGVLRDYWRSGLTVGAFGFVTGVVRAIALENSGVDQVVNVTSMVGALLSALVLVVLWRRFSFRFSTSRALRVAFPVLMVALALLPFLNLTYLDGFAGFAYMLYAFAQMILLVQCTQAARDRGVDAVFVSGFCCGTACLLQALGLICGWWAMVVAEAAALQYVTLSALLCACVLGMALYLVCAGRGTQEGGLGDEVEFMSLAPGRIGVGAGDARPAGGTAPGSSASPSGSRPIIRDRLSKQCEAIRLHYRLSTREAEVMEHIARGDTVTRIAEELEVSENTVRTHSKRIYAKLDVHSKQELGDLIAQFRPAEV